MDDLSKDDPIKFLMKQQLMLQNEVTRLAHSNGKTGITEKKDKKNANAKPAPFTGKSSGVCTFLAFFQNWASKQEGVRTSNDWIASALSYMTEDAADWAARYADQTLQALFCRH